MMADAVADADGGCLLTEIGEQLQSSIADLLQASGPVLTHGTPEQASGEMTPPGFNRKGKCGNDHCFFTHRFTTQSSASVYLDFRFNSHIHTHTHITRWRHSTGRCKVCGLLAQQCLSIRVCRGHTVNLMEEVEDHIHWTSS